MSERQKESSAQEYNALVDSLRKKVSLAIEASGHRISSNEGILDLVLNFPRSFVEKVRADTGSENYSSMEKEAILSETPRLRVRNHKGLIDIALKVDSDRAGTGGMSSHFFRLIEERRFLKKPRLGYYKGVEEISDEGSLIRIPLCVNADPTVNILKSFNRLLDYVFVKPEVKPIETAYIILPPEDAYKVVEHLEELGFEQDGLGSIHCWGKDGYYLMHIFEDENGRMVNVERFIDRTVIEMGEDLARYLANSGFSA